MIDRLHSSARWIAVGATLLLAGCAGFGGDPRADLPRVAEAWISVSTPSDNIDSVASWRTAEGKLLVIATAKEGNTLRVYDSEDGRFLRAMSGPGAGIGQLDRPNGIFVLDGLAFIVERDNHRVQVFDLARNTSIGAFGADDLRYPYGLWLHRTAADRFDVFVTDSYETADERVPPDAELDTRVKRFEVKFGDTGIEGRLVAAFGDTVGEGRLLTVESIWGDPAHNRLLVADENASRRDIKVYDFDGRFTGTLMGAGTFRNEPEGIARVDCDERSGYWIVSDQHTPHQIVRIFDRATLQQVAAFAPTVTHTVDGIWFEPDATPRFPRGALFTQHDDAAVSAFDWSEIAAALALRGDCPAESN